MGRPEDGKAGRSRGSWVVGRGSWVVSEARGRVRSAQARPHRGGGGVVSVLPESSALAHELARNRSLPQAAIIAG